MTTIMASPAVIKVKMGGLDVGKSPAVLETLLGSCVGIAVWDRSNKLGGLAHVVLPNSRGVSSLPGKFADTAVAELRRLLLLQGANPTALTAKIAGGATMFGRPSERDIGRQNHQAAVEHLRKHGIRLIGEHVGGDKGRLIRFSLHDGAVEVSIARKVVQVL